VVIGEEPGGEEKLMVAVGRTKVLRLVVFVRVILRGYPAPFQNRKIVVISTGRVEIFDYDSIVHTV
jgi:hypothetical protein